IEAGGSKPREPVIQGRAVDMERRRGSLYVASVVEEGLKRLLEQRWWLSWNWNKRRCVLAGREEVPIEAQLWPGDAARQGRVDRGATGRDAGRGVEECEAVRGHRCGRAHSYNHFLAVP